MMPTEPLPSVLFVEDDSALRRAIVDALDLEAISVTAMPDAAQALATLTPDFPGIVVSDIRMPGMDGLEFFSRIRELDLHIPVILISGHADVPMAVQALQNGAFDFLTKPFAMERLIKAVQLAQDYRTRALTHRELRAATETAAHANTLLMGESPAMVSLREAIARVAASDLDVLLEGETGTGKELAALTLHRLSKRRGKPFIPVNCGAISDHFADIELFGQALDASGYRRTGQVGRIEAADKGTLFLDEIDSMNPGIQVKLLRVLEERTLMHGTEPYPIDIRVIAAAKQDLESTAHQGGFRPDLFYRLNVVRLRMPPLRERREDILPLFAHFQLSGSPRSESHTYNIPDPVRRHLMEHHWPGNVRELRNYALSTMVNKPEDTPTSAVAALSLTDRVDAFEAALIRQALQAAKGNVSEVIDRLATPRKTLYGKLKRFGIDPSDYR